MSHSNRDGGIDGPSAADSFLVQRLARREHQLAELVDEVMRLRRHLKETEREVKKWKGHTRCMESCLVSLLRLELSYTQSDNDYQSSDGRGAAHIRASCCTPFLGGVCDAACGGRHHRDISPVYHSVRAAQTNAVKRDIVVVHKNNGDTKGNISNKHSRGVHKSSQKAQLSLNKLLALPSKCLHSSTRACAAQLLSTMLHPRVRCETAAASTGVDRVSSSRTNNDDGDDVSWSGLALSAQSGRSSRRGATQQLSYSSCSPCSVHTCAHDSSCAHTHSPSCDGRRRAGQPKRLSDSTSALHELGCSQSDSTHTLPDAGSPHRREHGINPSLARTLAFYDTAHNNASSTYEDNYSSSVAPLKDILLSRSAELAASIRRRSSCRRALLPPPPSPNDNRSGPSFWCAKDVWRQSPRRSAHVLPTPAYSAP